MSTHFANVFYRSDHVGVVSWDTARQLAAFQYTLEFVRTGIDLAPLMMPLREATYQFTNLHESFWGLPGLLADCLPDTYGNADR